MTWKGKNVKNRGVRDSFGRAERLLGDDQVHHEVTRPGMVSCRPFEYVVSLFFCGLRHEHGASREACQRLLEPVGSGPCGRRRRR